MIQRMFVTIDTKKTNYKNVGKINHGDDLILELTVLSDGDMISFNNPMVDLLVKKSDGKMIRQNSGIEHIQPNKFIIEVKKDCVTSPGLATNQLVINDNGRISTCMFYYTILNSLEEDVIQSISSVEVLEQLDEYVIEASERMELLNNGIKELEELFGATSDNLVEAEMARNEAEQNRAQSEILRVNNENDRIEADNIRNKNEADRSSSELVREQRESERIFNEEERRQNESERMIDESTRQQNENTRQSNESIRMSNENDRKTQENRRVTAEINRVNAETTRRNNENSRISNETERQKTLKEMKSLMDETEQNENTRQSNESIRMSNENDRKTQENSRVNAETNRVNAETNRVTAETNRVNSETTRRNNENSRISNETERQKTIEEVKSLIDEVNGFVERIRVIEDGIDDVCDSKIDFFGEEHDKLNTRLNADFDNVHQRINDSELIPYEGANIKADNSYYGLQKDTVIKGRTLQNLLSAMKPKRGLSFNNGVYETDPTINPHTGFETSGMIKINTKYTLVIEFLEIPTGINNINLFGSTEFGENYRISSPKTNTRYVATTTSKANEAVSIFYFGISPTNITEPIKFKAVLLEGDHTQTPLEELPYIEGVESVGDKSKNLFYDVFEEGQISAETGEEIVYNGRCRSVQYANIEPNKTYTVSMVQNVVSAPWTSIRLYKDDTYIKTVQDQHGKAKFTFESGEANRLRVTANIPYNDVINCQIEEGTQDTPYEPYYDGYKISGKAHGKNMVKSLVTDMQHNSGTYVMCEGNYTKRSSIIKLPKGKYSLSFEKFVCSELLDCGLYIWDNTESTSFKRRNRNLETFEILEDEVGITWYGSFATNERKDEVVGSFIQIEESETITPYEPYQESNYSYISNEPLRSLPNGVCDTIDLATGMLTRRVGIAVLDGNIKGQSFNMNLSIEKANHFLVVKNPYQLENLKQVIDYNNHICDKMPILNPYRDNINCTCLIYNANCIEFRLCLTGSEVKANDYINWLKENPLTFYFELAEPTTEQLTPQQLKSFDTTTHVISDNKLMPIVSTKIHSNVQAIISTLKLENSDLKNNVEVLSVENEELKETNIVQDEMIDISMMATDEMYSMLEPLLENTPMPMAFEREVSKLVYLYVAMVQRGLKTLDEVPTRYRDQVRAMIQYN